ncbi:hypothetical protein [uncultured Jatrophihabitans sp.]|uniref:hypothetical protein n=1 Tax=uncultured Jatrophihabitans sp. TaxID=1610747 RepID=UPI0035CBB387
MLDKIGGLPTHVLLIHVVVILVPLGALMLVASALWPAARAKLGFLTPAVALVALVFVPVTANAGEYLRDHLGFTNKAIQRHAELGGELLPWAAGVFVLAAVVWQVGRRRDLVWRRRPQSSSPGGAAGSAGGHGGGGATATLVRTEPVAVQPAAPVWATAVLSVLSVAVAVGAIWQLYRIGDSGAHAVWGGVLKGK